LPKEAFQKMDDESINDYYEVRVDIKFFVVKNSEAFGLKQLLIKLMSLNILTTKC
jgi:hypothetical protein